MPTLGPKPEEFWRAAFNSLLVGYVVLCLVLFIVLLLICCQPDPVTGKCKYTAEDNHYLRQLPAPETSMERCIDTLDARMPIEVAESACADMRGSVEYECRWGGFRGQRCPK